VRIGNAVMGPFPKRLLFTMIKTADFIGSLYSNPYVLRHYNISDFSLFVNGKHVPSDGLSLAMYHEKTSVIGYRTLFEGTGIYHSNSGLRIKHDMYINVYLMLLFDLTPDRGASMGHTSPPENGNIWIEVKFNKPLPEALTCLQYLEYDNSVPLEILRYVTTDFNMDTMQILF